MTDALSQMQQELRGGSGEAEAVSDETGSNDPIEQQIQNLRGEVEAGQTPRASGPFGFGDAPEPNETDLDPEPVAPEPRPDDELRRRLDALEAENRVYREMQQRGQENQRPTAPQPQQPQFVQLPQIDAEDLHNDPVKLKQYIDDVNAIQAHNLQLMLQPHLQTLQRVSSETESIANLSVSQSLSSVRSTMKERGYDDSDWSKLEPVIRRAAEGNDQLLRSPEAVENLYILARMREGLRLDPEPKGDPAPPSAKPKPSAKRDGVRRPSSDALSRALPFAAEMAEGFGIDQFDMTHPAAQRLLQRIQ